MVTCITNKKATFLSRSQEIDEEAKFPHENIRELVELGYTKVTLPKRYGGEGLGVYDMVLSKKPLLPTIVPLP